MPGGGGESEKEEEENKGRRLRGLGAGSPSPPAGSVLPAGRPWRGAAATAREGRCSVPSARCQCSVPGLSGARRGSAVPVPARAGWGGGGGPGHARVLSRRDGQSRGRLASKRSERDPIGVHRHSSRGLNPASLNLHITV